MGYIGKWFYVFWHEGNDPDEKGFYVHAKDANQVWAAIENTYGEEADCYDIMEVKHIGTKKWVNIRAGQFISDEDEY